MCIFLIKKEREQIRAHAFLFQERFLYICLAIVSTFIQIQK